MEITSNHPTTSTPIGTLVAKSLTATAVFTLAAIEEDAFAKDGVSYRVRKVEASKGGLTYPASSLYIVQ